MFEIGTVKAHPLLREGQAQQKPLARISNALPDRSIICPEVVGRRTALDQLWRWLADDLSHVKVLAGEGGIGKSSVAYEFADQVTLISDNPFFQVIWLSAKEKQFRPFRDTYEEMLETHFSTYDELVDTLCDHLAVLPDERADAPSAKKLRLIKNAFRELPSLVVIDDVDSLEASEQRQALEIGLLLGGTKSKLLLTTRKNTFYSADICYEIKGLAEKQFPEFFDTLCKRFPSAARRAPKASEIKLIWEASHGSPLYAESILRLLSFQTVGEAIKQWRGGSGDAVRKAALQREITQLMPEGKRVLLALARLGEASTSELSEVTGYSREKVAESLASISSLFLIVAPSLGPENRIRLDDTTCRLAVSIEADLTTDASRIERKVKELRQAASALGPKGNATIASAIRQASTLEMQGDIVGAISTLNDALRRVGKSKGHDLLAYIGYLSLKTVPSNPDMARAACREAYQGGVRKKKLFEAWFNAEWEAANFVGSEECARAAIENQQTPEYEWRIRLSAALTSKAQEQAGGQLGINALSSYIEASQELMVAMKRCPAADVSRWRPNLEDINDTIWAILRSSATSAIESYANAKKLAELVESGDLRIRNYSRLMEVILSGLRKERGRKHSETRGDLTATTQIIRLHRLCSDRFDKFPADLRHPALREAIRVFDLQVAQLQAS